jgi:serine/threonine protein kinase
MPVKLFEKLGDGAFADVWRGVDDLDRPVAVKIVRAAQLGVADALAHARALARTNHPNVVTVYRIDQVIAPDSGESCDCVVMELIAGGTLGQIFAAPDLLDDERVRRVGLGVIDGLEHIHRQGLVHGDFHEDNVMVGDDRVKIIDILYRETLALLSTASREFCLRRDLTGLRSLLEILLEHSILGEDAARHFARDIGARPSILDVRAAFESALSSGRTAEPDATNDDGDNVVGGALVNSVVYFYQDRLQAAFPGVRGLKEFRGSREIVDRLDILPEAVGDPRARC